MALPKRRHSKARRDKRKANWRRTSPTKPVVCSHCGQAKRAHRVCPHCGHYNGEEVLLVKEA